MIVSVNRLGLCKSEGEPVDKTGPDKASGYFLAGGRNGNGVL
mgnify:CR=1 FL=1